MANTGQDGTNAFLLLGLTRRLQFPAFPEGREDPWDWVWPAECA